MTTEMSDNSVNGMSAGLSQISVVDIDALKGEREGEGVTSGVELRKGDSIPSENSI